ncbi:hypothetical protein [Streptomyces sp. NPDC097619]|uniref:hypothetical protein n=1 Tax=Streptomyces sp. NPDC097619 TaxID=3157228 RepID=UPI00332FE8FE
MTKPSPSSQEPDDPKTETTLTTRIRINIPGSRPIPPVVVRKAVSAGEDKEPSAPAAASQPAGGSGAPAPADAPQGEPQSDWFAPRRGSGPPPVKGGAARGAAPSAPAGRPALGPGGGRGATAAPVPAGNGPATSGGTDMHNGTGPQGPGTGLPARQPGAPVPPRAGLPTRQSGPPAPGARSGFGAGAAATGAGFGGGPAMGTAPGRPAAPQGGPAAPAARNASYGPGPQGQGGPGYGGAPQPPAPQGPGPQHAGYPAPGPQGQGGPNGPTGGPALGTMPVTAPRADDDTTAIRQWPGPELAPGTPANGVPAQPRTPQPFPGVTAPLNPMDPMDPTGPEAAEPAPPPRPAPEPKKGGVRKRSKLVLMCTGVVSLLGVTYGAGLLLNHSDVPKGTTVFGVDIGGTRDEAVSTLDRSFGKRATAPLQLLVGDKQVELAPEKAGLRLDTAATVRGAAGSDYNPVSVISSLFGESRTAKAEIPVDEEKLRAALQALAGTAGTAVEGTIVFEPGKVTAVPGKAGQGLDVDRAVQIVTDAYRAQIETGTAKPVEVPVTDKQPVVDQAELDRAMEEFAKPAMSANVVVTAGGQSIPFGPSRSLPQILGMKVVDGKLVETYDLEAIKRLSGDTFKGVLITRGTGEKTAVTPQDIAAVLGKALRGTTEAERKAVIETEPS